MRWMLMVVGLGLCACGGEAGDDGGDETETGSAESAETWCCETKAGNGNERFSRFCGLTEDDAVSWMRNPDEVCWDDAG